MSDILSDPQARRREFGSDGLLRFPVQTAIKTGTSTDYRDAWAIGYSEAFTVGVWMGNLNRSAMSEISGARGPTLVLRSIFAELHRGRETMPLYLAPTIIHQSVCPITGLLPTERCPRIEEVFSPGNVPTSVCSHDHSNRKESELPTLSKSTVRIVMPTPGLNLANDPRIPDDLEAFPFEITAPSEITSIQWLVDDQEIGSSSGSSRRFLWPLVTGHHTVRARVTRGDSSLPLETAAVGFWVR
jgi:penicillin-binding protein 1C